MNIAEHAIEWLGRIDDEEGKAINRYTDDTSKRLNSYLRGVSENQNIQVTKQDIKDIALIQNAISKFNFDKPLTVYRGVGETEFKNILEGSNTHTFLEFKSTSIEQEIGSKFAYNQETRNKDDWHYLLKVNVPAYANGAYIEMLSEYDDEYEYLLNTNQKYKIVNEPITPRYKKLTILEIEVLSDE